MDLPLKPMETDLDTLTFADGEGKESRIIITPVNGENKMHLVNVNPASGYATIEEVNARNNVNKSSIPVAANASVSSVATKTSPKEPLIKSTLLPFNNVFGKLKTNLSNFAHRRDRSKSPSTSASKLEPYMFDSGEYVTIADVRNNNKKAPIYANNDAVAPTTKKDKGSAAPVVREMEYVSLNELPCNNKNAAATATAEGGASTSSSDSLERKRRQGARVTLDAEGKVVYSSDSLRRKKGCHTTFEPGPFVKDTCDSPLPTNRTPKPIRPVLNKQNDSRPMSPPPQGKLIIKASSGRTSPVSEIIRKPPSTIVRPMSPPLATSPRGGAYVNMQTTNNANDQQPINTATVVTNTFVNREGKNDKLIQSSQTAETPTKTFPKIFNATAHNILPRKVVKRSDSYKMANAPLVVMPSSPLSRKISNIERSKLDLEERIEKEIAAELWRDRINYPPTVSPKLCIRAYGAQNREQVREVLLNSPGKVIVPGDSAEHRARVLSVSGADTEIW